MEGALVSAATGALQPVIGKLGALLGDEYRRLRSIRTDINSLTLELKAIDAFLDNMSEEEDPNPQDKAWMNEVRELSYDVEDNIDDFMARVVVDKSARPDGFMAKIKSSLDRTKARHRISKAIEDLKKQAIEVSQRNARYRSGEAAASNTSNAPKVDRRALAIFEDASKLVGVDGPKRELIQLLADCDPTKQHPNVVSIVGFGGLGKTTLANKVYQELKGQFDCHAFVSVSRNPDIRGVLSSVYSQLNKSYHPRMEELQQLITMMLDFLRHKRYFIVVDDIWKVEIWEVIKCAFPTTGFGNKIITTTRINVVAQSCCSQYGGHIYNIRPLSMVHSRQLLFTRLFNPKEKCPSHLERVSDQILEKCAGLPLAIIAISGVLAVKAKTKDLWEQVKDSVGRALRTSCVEDMVNIISLSYLDLPRHLKTCLLYLSIFPEDHIIEKENLVRRWIGEGFIHKRAGYSVHESGEMCFNELINRSLIQPVKIDKTFSDHEVKSCRVHDTILDFLISKGVEENFVTIIGVPGVVNPNPRNKVRRLSLQNNGEIPPGHVLTSARSLHVFGSNVKIPSLSDFRLLRVMDFEGCHQLKDDDLAGIGNLLHLKYLSFQSVGDLTKFPEQVARLPHLEIDIHGDLTEMEIPETICRLQQFVTLDLYTDAVAPDEVADMEGLHVLEGVNVYSQSTEFLEGLGQLKNLRKLGIRFNTYDACGDALEENGAVVASSISELGKANLVSLHIYIEEAPDYIFGESWFPDPPRGLRELVVKGVSHMGVPSWMASLVDLEKLHLPVRYIEEEGMEILRGLPSLRHLSIMFWVIDSEDGPELEAAMERAMETHPNRPTLVWAYKCF